MEPKIHVAPARSSFLAELDEFRVSGLQPMNMYRVELTLVHKTKFIANAFFITGETGEIDLAKQAPLFGFYKGADKMGLFTALYQDPRERFGSKLNLTPVPDSLTYKISVHFMEEPLARAEVEIERVVKAGSVVREELEHEKLVGTVFYPKEHDSKLRAILDLSGVGGQKEHRAAFLAEQGYYVLSLALYGKSEKLPTTHETVETEYILAAIDYITSLPQTTDQVVLIGTSLGGTWSYHAATRSEKVKAAVSINGQGGYYFVSQIRENGKKLPWVQLTPTAMSQVEIENGCVSYAKMYGACKAEEKHQIPIEKLKTHQNLLYIASEWDKAIPAVQQLNWMEERMKKAKKEAQFSHDTAKKGCHMLDVPFMPICDVTYVAGKFLLFGGDPYVSGCEQRRIWPKILDFIRQNFEEAH
ncbi:unnamed protein product, partial [Mesorhabditis spiculigera]